MDFPNPQANERGWDEVLKTAVKRENWAEVASLFRDNNYSSSSVEIFIAACEQYSVIHVDRDILSHCSSQQKSCLLKTAVSINRWRDVASLLQDGNYSSSIVDHIILSHCSSQQKDCLLKAAVSIKRWRDVNSLLKDENYSSSIVEQFVTACEQNKVIHVDGEILSHCSSQQRDRLLTITVELCRKNGLRWNNVKILLQDCNYSSSSVEQFVTACEQYEVIHVDGEILSHCSSEQKDRLLKTAVNLWRSPYYSCTIWERWNDVKLLLQDCNYSCSSVEQFLTACEQYDAINLDDEILSHFSLEQSDRLVEMVVMRQSWKEVYRLLKTSVSLDEVDSLLRDINYSSSRFNQFITTCEKYGVIHVDGRILSHCSSEQKDHMLTIAVKVCSRDGGGWKEVKSLLQVTNYSSSSVEQFVAACEQYEVIHVDGEILYHCSSEQKDRLLKTAVKLCIQSSLLGYGKSRNKVASVLQASNYSSSNVEQFVAACEQYEVIHVDREILSHCSSEQKDRLLKIAVKLCSLSCFIGYENSRNKVASLLQDTNYSSSSVEQFVTACEQHNVIHVDGEILYHCSSEQKNRLLKIAVMTKGWKEVDNLLQDNNYSSSSVEQFVSACEQHNVIHVDREILSHCSSEQRDRLLKIAVKTKTWKDVDNLLKDSNFSSSFVEQFITLCEQHGAICVNKDLLSHCTSEQHGRLLQRGVRRRRWDRVNDLLQYLHYSSTFVDHLITACEKDHVVPDCPGLLSHCSTQQLDRLVTLATTQKQWYYVHNVLKAAGSKEKRLWVIQHACNNANDYDFRHILPHITDDLLSHCNTELLDSLLTKVTRLRRWDIIDKVLRVGGSPAKRVCVFKEACQTADHLNFQSCILPHCDDQLHNQITNPHTQSGLTVLFSAMLNEHYPRIMVAECIRLGFSTHQPPTVMTTPTDIAETVTRAWMRGWENATVSGIITSPFLLAVLRGMPVVAHMLYESGSSSYAELLHLYTVLLDLSDPHTEDGRKLNEGEYLTDWERLDCLELFSEQYKALMKTLTTFLPYLREMASTPRSLVSTCRLVISHCLTGGGERDRAVKDLDLTVIMKDYLLLSDLTDPDYQPLMYRTT